MYNYLQNKDAMNVNSMNYVPTYEEMNLPKDLIRRLETEWEDEAKTKRNNLELDHYMSKWQLNHRNKLITKKKIKESERSLKLAAHWFNTLQSKEIESLINNSRSIVDQVIDELRTRIKSDWELNYLEELRLRVKKESIDLTPASNAKLKRFPKYNMGTNELHGSVYTFYRLWAHVFKSHKRIGQIIIKG